MLIQITQRDIDLGQRSNCTQCAMARAIERATGKVTRVYLDPPTAHIDLDVVPLPEDARIFLLRFDRGDPVKPMSFQLDYKLVGTPDAINSDGYILDYKTASKEQVERVRRTRCQRPVFEIDVDELDMRCATAIVDAALKEELRV